MPARKRTYDEPQPILTGRVQSDLKRISEEDATALAKAILGAVTEGSSAYISPGRYGSVTLKFYIDGQAYAETLNPGDNWPDLAESVVEALWNKETVSRVRKLFDGQRDERPQETRKPAGRVQVPGE
jgi:hypothetical protein